MAMVAGLRREIFRALKVTGKVLQVFVRWTEHAARRGIEQLTLYCLSSENWQRPQTELDFLMLLLEQYMVEERSLLMRERVRLVMIGRRDGLPKRTLAAIDETVDLCSKNDGMRLCLAVNYGGRAEIVEAAKTLAHQVASGQLHPDEIDESSIESQLETNGMPDPDLLIRTAGEMRISNFLLWADELCRILGDIRPLA